MLCSPCWTARRAILRRPLHAARCRHGLGSGLVPRCGRSGGFRALRTRPQRGFRALRISAAGVSVIMPVRSVSTGTGTDIAWIWGFPVPEHRPRCVALLFSRFSRCRAASGILVFFQSCCIFLKILCGRPHDGGVGAYATIACQQGSARGDARSEMCHVYGAARLAALCVCGRALTVRSCVWMQVPVLAWPSGGNQSSRTTLGSTGTCGLIPRLGSLTPRS
jgi:hypothetical protein